MFSARILTVAAVATALGACGGEDPGAEAVRLPVSVVQATPSGELDRTVPIEFTLSKPIASPVVEGSVAISPPVPLQLRWMAPDRLAAIPREPLKANTRYVARLLPSAVGPRHRLTPSPPLRFHTPLFSVDMIDSDGRPVDESTPGEIRRVWIGFTHAVTIADIQRYVVVRVDDADRADIPFEVSGGRVACRNCELLLFKPASAVHVEVAAELRPAVGGVPLEKPVKRRLSVGDSKSFRLLDARAVQTAGRLVLMLQATHSLVDPIPVGAVRIEPSVGHRVNADGRYLVVVGSFEPETTYQVSVPALEARDGHRLAELFEASVQTPALAAELAIRSEAPVLSPTDVDPVVVNSVGVRALSLRTFAVPIENLAHVIGRLDEPNRLPWPTLGEWSPSTDVDVTGLAKATSETVIRAPAGARPGLRLLEVRASDSPWLVDRRWLQAGWALNVKRGVERTRVQVLDAATRRPVGGVDVRLRTVSNDPIGPVRTDGRGVAMLPHGADDEIELVVADRRGETAVLDLTESETRRDPAPLDGRRGLEAFVLPAQDRFRRGDPLPVLIVVRGLGLTLPSDGTALKVHLRGPNGRIWARHEVQLWRVGGTQASLSWPMRAPDGLYTVEVLAEEQVIGRAKVRLQGQQALPSSRVSLPKVDTSTGSARLSWSPVRPRPGQAIRVRWLAPTAGWVTLSLESTQVLAEVRREVGQGPASFTMAIPRAAVPGAHLVVTFEPLGDGVAISDRVWIEVGRRRPLGVRLELPPGPHRSGSTVSARVQVRGVGKDGAHVILRAAAPDTLDANLAEERDLFRFFHRRRAPSWRTHAASGRFARQAVLSQGIGEPRAVATLARGGSTVTEPGRIRAGAGRRIFLTLPKRQGKLRVDAIGWSERRLGSATAEIEVRDPLAIEAAMPPVMTVGDTLEVPVRVFRGPDGPASVILGATTKGGLSVVSTSTAPIELVSGGKADRVVRVRAIRPGTLELQATTENASAVWRGRVDVQPAGPSQIASTSARIPSKRVKTLAWPSLSGRSRVVVGLSPAYRLGAAMTRLARADRDDLETAAARALVRQVLPDVSRPTARTGPLAGRRGRWTTNLDAIERCLSADGPRAWPNGPPAEVGSVVFAGHAIARAARRGLISKNYDRWISAVRAAVRSGAATPRTTAYGQWVLALGRRADRPMLQQLQAQWARRSPDLGSGAALGAALVLAGLEAQAAPFLKFSDVAALETTEAAFVLAALMDGAPNHASVPDLAGQLLTTLSSGGSFGFRTDALALTGLASVKGGAETRRIWGRLNHGERQLQVFKGVERSVIGDFDETMRTTSDLRLSIEVGMPVFASVVVEGASAASAAGAVKVKYRLLDARGRPVDTARVGDRLTLDLQVGPLPDNVPDLRLALPVPGGLTVTAVEPPDGRARTSREPGMISFDLRASARAVLQVKLQTSATYAGDFALGPAVVSSALRPSQTGRSAAGRLTINPRP